MSHWGERRARYVSSRLFPAERQEYECQIVTGNNLLDEGYILLASPCKPPDDPTSAVHLASKIITTATDLSTGLERLRVADVDDMDSN
jgi:hypothetical protein